MKLSLIIALIALVGAVLIASRCSESRDNAAKADDAAKAQPAEFSLSAADDEGNDLPEREEIRHTLKLAPGKMVFIIGINEARIDTDGKQAFVMGINGGVKVETAETDMAEVLIVRSARTREDLRHRRVKITKDEDLFIQIEDDRSVGPARRSVRGRLLRLFNQIEDDGSLGPVPETRERVVLRLPRQAGIEIHEINGQVAVGEVGGRLEVRGVNGVRVARAAGPIEFSDINGGVDVTFAPRARNRVEIRDVNGNVDLRFEGEANSEINAWSVNGAINPDLPNVEKLPAEPSAGSFKARIGRGGAAIEVHDINGNVMLAKAEKSGAPKVAANR